jgi:hypothetical protein
MVVLPLLGRTRLDTTCLVIGAMAPDFEYFVHGKLVGTFGHSLLGIAGWGVPITLVTALAFHALVKWPLVAIAPGWIARRAAAFARRPWRMRPIACVVSAVIGDLTHLGWDGFTHAAGWGERHFRWIDHRVTVPILGQTPWFRVFQHVSSIVGLIVVISFVARVLRRAPATDVTPDARARLAYLACIAPPIAVLVYRAIAIHLANDVGTLVVAPISGLLAGTLVAGFVLRRAGERARARVMEAR